LTVSSFRNSLNTIDEGGDAAQNPAQKRHYLIMKLRQVLVDNTDLMERCRSFSFNFEWIFNTLYTLSPPVEENGPTMPVPFECLQKKIIEEKFPAYPIYIIELERFLRVTKNLDVNLAPNEIEMIGSLTHSFKKSKKYGRILFYDKFLTIIRNACLSRDEIRILKKANRGDDLPEEHGNVEQPKVEEKPGVVSYAKFLAEEVTIGNEG
jgi:hypothetical protein